MTKIIHKWFLLQTKPINYILNVKQVFMKGGKVMMKKIVSKAYYYFSYFITYLLCLSFLISAARFILNRYSTIFYNDNYSEVNVALLCVLSAVSFWIVKECYAPATWINRLH